MTRVLLIESMEVLDGVDPPVPQYRTCVRAPRRAPGHAAAATSRSRWRRAIRSADRVRSASDPRNRRLVMGVPEPGDAIHGAHNQRDIERNPEPRTVR